jgi:CRISPR-associated endonuclease/helicase Cas3
MNVLLISQCDKRALTETRRILDQFAERRGDGTWQTSITQDGLDTLRKLLRKTARKNTAVACHWIRGLDHSELLWVVGDASRFNAEGAVPTNITASDVLRHRDENDWHTAQDIRLLAQLSALLHDLGKASVAFQERLAGTRTERNLYRHEWVSLRLFQAFVGNDDDEGWLRRLANSDAFDEREWLAPGRYQRDGIDAVSAYPFRALPPLAAATGWLVVTHHRLPVVPVHKDDGSQAWLGKRAGRFENSWLETPLADVAHDWNEVDAKATPTQAEPYWVPASALPVVAPAWRSHAARIASKLLQLRERRDGRWLDNAYVMHLARLSLMLADHHYSSLGVGKDNKPVAERAAFLHAGQSIDANTTRDKSGRIVRNQSLIEHLLGVGRTAGLVAQALPGFERHLPRLANHRGLRKRSADSRFGWQDKAFDAAVGMRVASRDHGAFIVNMASTGCGKTLANARILYALADPQLGMRASYALGLRTLTLQTGRSYRHDLHLGDDELAVLVGGSASRRLFEYYEQQAESGGSASTQSLLEEDSHVLYEGNVAEHPLLSRALADPEIRRLISAPMLVCTVDHLAPATESLRAGRQIAPMLRLMSSDLVLDELDDYDLDDLPALTRLVHWAGLLGARVVLSSATLPPAFVEGMFMAYRAGRRQFLCNRGHCHGFADAPPEVPCLWTDEFGVQVQTCLDDVSFADAHRRFVDQRVSKLDQAEPLRVAELWPLPIGAKRKDDIRKAFAAQVRDACLRMHADHVDRDPKSDKRVSFGVVRMANIDPIIDVACELHRLGAPQGMRIHLCVYHARFPLVQRSAMEHMLDTAFNRRNADAVWRATSVRSALDRYPENDQIFVVLASPVCEVGRDWDADWAVAEPSSMRALIQLAGRVQRHRRKTPRTANVLVFETNLKHFEQLGSRDPAFIKPGFETKDDRFRLEAHGLRTLLREEDLRRLNAIPRIRPRALAERNPRKDLVDLEHARIEAGMLPRPSTAAATSRRAASPSEALQRDQSAPSWQYPQAALSGVLPQQQPFRHDERPGTTLVWLPVDDEENPRPHRVEDDAGRPGQDLCISADEMLHRFPLESAPGISAWGEFDLAALLSEQAESMGKPLEEIARSFSVLKVPSNDKGQGWRWHPWLGFTPQR